MRRTLLPALALALLAAAGAALWLAWAGPAIDSPLALGRFDEPRIRQRVLDLSRSLLKIQGDLDLSLRQEADEDTLRRMHRLYGIAAANRYASLRVPVLAWSYSVAPPGLPRQSFGKGPARPLTVRVGSDGAVLGLDRELDKAKDPPLPLSFEEAREGALSLLRLVGVPADRAVLTGTKTSESEGATVYEFTWKESPEGLPGLQFQYDVTLRSGYIVAFQRKTTFRDGEDPMGWGALLPALGAGVAWFFLALMTLVLFIQELRKDQVDMPHARKVALAAGILALGWGLSDPSGGWVEALVGGLVAGLFSMLFYGFLWSVGESLLRQAAPERLRHADWILHGQIDSQDLGRKVLWAWGWGLAFLLLPAGLLMVGSDQPGLGVSILPAHMRLENLHFPGGLLGAALLGPLPAVTLLGLTFLGVFYPVLRLRFSRGPAAGIFCTVFVLAATPMAGAFVGPWGMAAALALLAGALLFGLMERAGIVAALLALYLPLALRNAALLAEAKNTSMRLQGLLALGLLAALFAATVLLAAFGRTHVRARDYEPDYLRRMRERERFARELEIAKVIQQRFLPRSMPDIPGFEVAATCVPAMEVGGDIYDLLPMPGGRWFLLIGDVSGKGVKAAFYMTLTKGILHAITSAEEDDRTVIRSLNRIFRGLTEDGVFLTLCAVVLEPEKCEARFLSAGHNPPLLLRRGEVRALEPRGIVLGLVDDAMFQKSLEGVSLKLEPGDILLTYTDGVTEAMDRDEEQFGMERLADTLRASAHLEPKGVIRAVVDAVKAFEDGAPQADDLTLLVVKCRAT